MASAKSGRTCRSTVGRRFLSQRAVFATISKRSRGRWRTPQNGLVPE
jgi:hypothetical protein